MGSLRWPSRWMRALRHWCSARRRRRRPASTRPCCRRRCRCPRRSVPRWRGWPAEARRSEWTRALWQIEQLEGFCRRSEGQARITTSAAALEENVAQGRLSAILGVEGGHAIEGQVERVAELPKGQPLVTQCQTGGRSAIAASLLRRAGFEDVSNLTGGYGAWELAGLPIER